MLASRLCGKDLWLDRMLVRSKRTANLMKQITRGAAERLKVRSGRIPFDHPYQLGLPGCCQAPLPAGGGASGNPIGTACYEALEHASDGVLTPQHHASNLQDSVILVGKHCFMLFSAFQWRAAFLSPIPH